MSNRPVNSRGELLADPVSWNPYDKGYRTGAQASLFIGPIWVEEIVSVQLSTQSSDIPVYPYSGPYFDRLMLGNYQITGQIGITYTEPDYLLRVIELSKDASIKDSELRNLIENRKSIFLSSVKHRIYEELGDEETVDLEQSRFTEYAINYIERIAREVETTSLNEDGKLDPQNFEMTIIMGNPYSNSQIIEMYENVKIIGTGKVIANDDNPAIEMYSFVGKKKPDRKVTKTVQRPGYFFSRPNLTKLAREVIDKLVDEILNPPRIKVYGTDVRTSRMFNTDNIAVSGMLPSTPRLYGKSASFSEIVYALEYKDSFKNVTSSDSKEEIHSDTQVELIHESTHDSKNVPVYLTPPQIKEEGGLSDNHGFDNRFGRIVVPDRKNTINHITAIAPIEPINTEFNMGGSIVMPRYQTRDFGAGSYYPPGIVDVDSFTYNDNDLSVLTYGTLWCSTFGFRSTSSRLRNTLDMDENPRVDSSWDKYITEIAQPVNTMALIETLEASWNEEEFTLKIPIPRLVDFCNLAYSGPGKRTKKQPDVGQPGNYLNFNFGEDGLSIEPEGHIFDRIRNNESQAADTGETGGLPPDNSSEIFEKSVIGVFYDTKDIPEFPGEQGDVLDLDPHYFSIKTNIGSNELAATTNKSISIRPFIFFKRDTGESFNLSSRNGLLSKLSYLMNKRGDFDDSCDVELVYDASLIDQSGYFTTDGDIEVGGIYFLKGINEPHDINELSEIEIFWVMTIIPNLFLPYGTEDQSGIEIIHDIEDPCGRYLEIYNITRCDGMMHNATKVLDTTDGLWDRIIGVIHNIFSEVFPSINTTNLDYTYPIKTRWERYAGFLRGYAFGINIPMITEQVLNCSFSEQMSSRLNKPAPGDDDRGWTLSKAFDHSHGEGVESDIFTEINTIVRMSIEARARELRIRVIDYDDNRGIMVLENETLLPSNSIVSYGLTEEGAEELKSMTLFSESSAETGESIILDSYGDQ